MKKVVFLFLAISTIALTSCSKEDILGKGATVKVTVKKLGLIKSDGITVYMFDEQKIDTSDNFFKPIHADESSVTENGVATFEIGGEYFIGDNQKTFYFAIFDGDYYYKTATTIKQGETKKVSISY